MKKNKKILFPSILLALGIFLLGGFLVNAASKSNDNVQNHLQIPVIQGEIKETFTPDVPIKMGEKPQVKEVSVENKGNTPFFVRVMVFPEIMTASDNLLASNLGKEVLIDVTSDWLDGNDGYFYYKGSVLPGKTTADLFKTVKISDSLDDTYEDANFSIQIKIETVTNSSYQYRKLWWNGDIATSPTNNEWKQVDDSLAPLVKKIRKEG